MYLKEAVFVAVIRYIQRNCHGVQQTPLPTTLAIRRSHALRGGITILKAQCYVLYILAEVLELSNGPYS